MSRLSRVNGISGKMTVFRIRKGSAPGVIFGFRRGWDVDASKQNCFKLDISWYFYWMVLSYFLVPKFTKPMVVRVLWSQNSPNFENRTFSKLFEKAERECFGENGPKIHKLDILCYWRFFGSEKEALRESFSGSGADGTSTHPSNIASNLTFRDIFIEWFCHTFWSQNSQNQW